MAATWINTHAEREAHLDRMAEDQLDHPEEDEDYDDGPRCTDSRGHKWVVSDENENYCYCERCGCCEY